MVSCECGKEAIILSGENNFCEECYERKKDEAKFERDKHILEVAPKLRSGNDAMDRRIARNTAKILGGVSEANYDKIVQQDVSINDFEFIWEKDLYDYELEDKEWLIQDLIPTCSVGVWTGKRGTMKTFIILNAISCISTGEPFLGHYATKKSKIIYLDKENGVQIMKQRMPLIKKGLEITENLDIGFICFSTLKIDKTIDIQKLEKIILEHKPSLLVVDTYRRGISFEENDAGAVSKLFVDILRPLVEKYKISIVLIHHDKKGESQGDEMDMIRGSSDLANYCDFILKNERKGNDLIIKQLKMRNAPEIKPIDVSVEVDDETHIKFEYKGEHEMQTKDQKSAEALTIWIIKNKLKEFSTGEAQKEATSLGIKKNNFYNGLQVLVNTGLIEKEAFGKYRVNSKDSRLFV